MHRTTIYLPDDLRAELALAARADRRSEADLIREGVERVLRERLLHEQPPEPHLFDSGHPGLGLALDWFFEGAPTETLDWLVCECRSVWAEQLPPDGPSFAFRASFRDEEGNERWWKLDRGAMSKADKTWGDICWSLALWQGDVKNRRGLPAGEVLVTSRWQPDQPPTAGAPPEEIARVEVRQRATRAARRKR